MGRRAEINSYSGWSRTASGAPAFAVLTWLGLYALAVGQVGERLQRQDLRWLAIGLQGVAVGGLVPAMLDLAARWPLKVIALLSTVGGVYAGHLLAQSPDAAADEKEARRWISLSGCVLTLVWLVVEIADAFWTPGTYGAPAQLLESLRNHWILLAISLYGLAVTGVGLWLRSLHARVLGQAISVFAAAGILTVGLGNLAAPIWLRVATFVCVAGGLYATSALLRALSQRSLPQERRSAELAATVMAALTVAWLTVQARQVFALALDTARVEDIKGLLSTLDFTVSALWGVYGFAVLVTGFIIRHQSTRILGLAILALTLGKIGVLDMWRLDVGWRIWITLGLGVIFVVASLMYQRFARIIVGDRRPSDGGPETG